MIIYPIELPSDYVGRVEVRGFLFKQITKSFRLYLYKVSGTFENRWYELFKRRDDSRFGKIADPKSNSFGISAWSLRIIEEAFENKKCSILMGV